MSDEKTLGLNNGEENPSGAGQPDDTKSTENPELESEIDKIIGNKNDDDDDLDLGDEDDTVVLPKKKVQELLRDRKNYKQGLLSVKEKIKGLGIKKTTPKTEEKPNTDDTPLTRGDLVKINSKKAIDEACKDEETEKNWTEIVKFYSPRRGKDTSEAIIADIQDAKTLWEKSHPKDDGKKDEDKKSSAELAAEKGKPTGGKGEGKEQKRKSVLAKQTSVKEWY